MTAIGAPPAAGRLYDTRRGVYYTKPTFRGWLHLLWFVASLAAGPLLLARAHGAAQTTAIAVYSVSVTALFGFQRAVSPRHLDHCLEAATCSAWITR